MVGKGRPSQHFRIDPDLWRHFGEVAEQAGVDRSVLLRAFVSWYTSAPGAELPKRQRPRKS